MMRKLPSEKFKVYYQNGGNLLLTRYATFYIKDLSIAKDERVPNNSWGERRAHPKSLMGHGLSNCRQRVASVISGFKMERW